MAARAPRRLVEFLACCRWCVCNSACYAAVHDTIPSDLAYLHAYLHGLSRHRFCKPTQTRLVLGGADGWKVRGDDGAVMSSGPCEGSSELCAGRTKHVWNCGLTRASFSFSFSCSQRWSLTRRERACCIGLRITKT
eukprot:862903-Rhodomonas_salina.1